MKIAENNENKNDGRIFERRKKLINNKFQRLLKFC